jgi:hypothetical protein
MVFGRPKVSNENRVHFFRSPYPTAGSGSFFHQMSSNLLLIHSLIHCLTISRYDPAHAIIYFLHFRSGFGGQGKSFFLHGWANPSSALRADPSGPPFAGLSPRDLRKLQTDFTFQGIRDRNRNRQLAFVRNFARDECQVRFSWPTSSTFYQAASGFFCQRPQKEALIILRRLDVWPPSRRVKNNPSSGKLFATHIRENLSQRHNCSIAFINKIKNSHSAGLTSF